MAYMTVKQCDALTELRRIYGEPDRVLIEDVPSPYGVLRVVWFEAQRSIFVRPDGERLFWEYLEVKE